MQQEREPAPADCCNILSIFRWGKYPQRCWLGQISVGIMDWLGHLPHDAVQHPACKPLFLYFRLCIGWTSQQVPPWSPQEHPCLTAACTPHPTPSPPPPLPPKQPVLVVCQVMSALLQAICQWRASHMWPRCVVSVNVSVWAGSIHRSATLTHCVCAGDADGCEIVIVWFLWRLDTKLRASESTIANVSTLMHK